MWPATLGNEASRILGTFEKIVNKHKVGDGRTFLFSIIFRDCWSYKGERNSFLDSLIASGKKEILSYRIIKSRVEEYSIDFVASNAWKYKYHTFSIISAVSIRSTVSNISACRAASKTYKRSLQYKHRAYTGELY